MKLANLALLNNGIFPILSDVSHKSIQIDVNIIKCICYFCLRLRCCLLLEEIPYLLATKVCQQPAGTHIHGL
jgi:hypothetical protein